MSEIRMLELKESLKICRICQELSLENFTAYHYATAACPDFCACQDNGGMPVRRREVWTLCLT